MLRPFDHVAPDSFMNQFGFSSPFLRLSLRDFAFLCFSIVFFALRAKTTPDATAAQPRG